MLMLVKTHAEIVAAKDAEIAGLSSLVDTLTAEWEATEVRLAVFTAPRARDAKGHFMPTSKKYSPAATLARAEVQA